METHPYFYNLKTHKLLKRTYRKLWNAEPDRYKQFVQEINNMRRYTDTEPNENYPRGLNKRVNRKLKKIDLYLGNTKGESQSKEINQRKAKGTIL